MHIKNTNTNNNNNNNSDINNTRNNSGGGGWEAGRVESGGSGGDGGSGGGRGPMEEENTTLTPFLTPQHLAKTPAQSFYSVINSRDSLDQYHDAYSSLQRPSNNKADDDIGRQRRASSGIGGGQQVELGIPARSQEAMATNTASTQSGRTRHSSYSSAQQQQNQRQQPATNPHCLSRHSLSSASLRLGSTRDSPQAHILPAPPRKVDTSPLHLQQITGNWRQNYRPCVDVAIPEGDSAALPPKPKTETVPDCGHTTPLKNLTAVKHSYQIIENNNDDGWMRNYVACVEGRELLLGENGDVDGDVASGRGEERVLQLDPENLRHHHHHHRRLNNNKDAELQLRSCVLPGQRRRKIGPGLRDEFRRDNFRLDHKLPHLFVVSQWQQHNRMSCLYLGYRLFWALYFTMWAVWALVGSFGYDSPAIFKLYFLTYLTNWSVWFLALDTSLQAVNVVLHLKKISDDGEVLYPSMPGLLKVSWVLSNMMGAVHIFITLGYWTLVYPYRNDEQLNEIGINTHMMPAIYILLDVTVSATPRRLAHAFHPMLYLTTYTVFNLTYYLCGGRDYMGRPALYPMMDWTRPGPTVGIVLGIIFAFIPLLHALLCLLYAARVKLWRTLKMARYAADIEEMETVDGSHEQKV